MVKENSNKSEIRENKVSEPLQKSPTTLTEEEKQNEIITVALRWIEKCEELRQDEKLPPLTEKEIKDEVIAVAELWQQKYEERSQDEKLQKEEKMDGEVEKPSLKQESPQTVDLIADGRVLDTTTSEQDSDNSNQNEDNLDKKQSKDVNYDFEEEYFSKSEAKEADTRVKEESIPFVDVDKNSPSGVKDPSSPSVEETIVEVEDISSTKSEVTEEPWTIDLVRPTVLQSILEPLPNVELLTRYNMPVRVGFLAIIAIGLKVLIETIIKFVRKPTIKIKTKTKINLTTEFDPIASEPERKKQKQQAPSFIIPYHLYGESG